MLVWMEIAQPEDGEDIDGPRRTRREIQMRHVTLVLVRLVAIVSNFVVPSLHVIAGEVGQGT
jgi:hypothetical protein